MPTRRRFISIIKDPKSLLVIGIFLLSLQILLFNLRALGAFWGFEGTPIFVHDPLTNYRLAASFFLQPSLSYFRYPDWFLFSWPALFTIKLFHAKLTYKLVSLLTSITTQTFTLVLLLLIGKRLRLHPLAQLLSISIFWSTFLCLPMFSYTEVGFMGDTSAGLALLVMLYTSIRILQEGFSPKNTLYLGMAILFSVHTKSIAIVLSLICLGCLLLFYFFKRPAPYNHSAKNKFTTSVLLFIALCFWLFFPRTFFYVLEQMYLANGQSHYFWIHDRLSLYLVKSLLSEFTYSILLSTLIISASIIVYCLRRSVRKLREAVIGNASVVFLHAVILSGIFVFSMVPSTDARNCYLFIPSLTLLIAVILNFWLSPASESRISYQLFILALIPLNIGNLYLPNSLLDKSSYEREGVISTIDLLRKDIALSKTRTGLNVFLPHHSHFYNSNTFWSAELLRHPIAANGTFPELGFRVSSAAFKHNPFSKDPSPIPIDFFTSDYVVLVSGERSGEKNNGEDIQNLLIFDRIKNKNPAYLDGLKLLATTNTENHGTILIYKRHSAPRPKHWLVAVKEMLNNDLCNTANQPILRTALSIAPKDLFLLAQNRCSSMNLNPIGHGL